MADTSVAQSPAASASNTAQKKTKSPKAKKIRSSPNHPKVSEMVNSAISNLKERGGSSLQAIKKYIAANYKVDAEKISPFIKKYLKTAVTNGTLIQTKGKGASGSFKLSASHTKKEKKESTTTTPKKARSVPEKKKIGTPKPKKAVEKKKVAKPKKSPKKAEKQKKVAEKKPKSPKKAKTPKKEKKAKTPKKPRSPKPKKAAAKKTPRK